jgi:predicted RNase H-like nuclease (RuvC/YqgF family)
LELVTLDTISSPSRINSFDCANSVIWLITPQDSALYCAQVPILELAIMSVKMADVSAQVPTDDFEALEQKVYRTIEMYKAAREAKSVAERDAQRLREQLEEREEEVESLRREAVQLKREREEIRGRVEKMLHQIESISEEQAAS